MYSRTMEKLMVWRWKGGFFEIDTLETPFSRGSDRVTIYPTKDAFVVITGGRIANCQGLYTKTINQAYYYRWNGDTWVPHLISTGFGGKFVANVKVEANTFAISYYTCTDDGSNDMEYTSYICYGAYDFATQQLNQPSSIGMPYSRLANKFAVGPNSVSYIGGIKYRIFLDTYIKFGWCSLNRFSDGGWTQTRIDYPQDSYRLGREMRAVPNGVVWALDNDDEGHYSYICSAFYRANGWKTRSLMLSSDNINRQVTELHGTSHYVIAQYLNPCHTDLFRWAGTNYAWRLEIDHDGHTSHYAQAFNGSYAFGANTYFCGPLRGRQFLGNNSWSGTILDTPTIWSNKWAAAEQYAIGNTGTNTRLFLYRPFSNGIGSDYVTYGVHETSSSLSRFFAADDVFFVDDYNTEGATEVMCKLIDELSGGPARIVIVDSIAMYCYADDPDPKRVKYKYYQGLVSSDGRTPRFAKAEVSLPYFASENGPEGWSVTYFYNDLSHLSVTDGHFAETVIMPYFGLQSYPPYGVPLGGYLLDGMPHLRYAYTTGSGIEEEVDYTMYHYSLLPTSDSLKDIYQILLMQTESRTNGIIDTTRYEYDEYNGQVTAKRVTVKDGWAYHTEIEETVYAYNDLTDTATANAMKADNAIVQPLSTEVTFNDWGQLTVLSMSGQRYEKHGNWVPVKQFTWRDFDNLADTLFTTNWVTFDTLGNQISAKDAMGVNSSVKYDSSGVQAIASASNCIPSALTVQDFEQGMTWDAWEDWPTDAYHFFDEDAFTGDYSFTMTDNPNAVEANNWSPYKEFS
jgi:hypothetical protein